MTLADKLRPDRFSAMSGRMAAIVGYILNEPWTEPAIAALSVTTDGYVTTESEFFGEAADLDRNLLNLFIAADLTPEERPISSAATASASTTGGRSSPGPPPPRTA
jgi:hypothetical protein